MVFETNTIINSFENITLADINSIDQHHLVALGKICSDRQPLVSSVSNLDKKVVSVDPLRVSTPTKQCPTKGIDYFV